MKPSQPRACVAVLPAGATQVDRDLVNALAELSDPSHAESECNDSIRPLAIEAIGWIGLALSIWLVVAIVY